MKNLLLSLFVFTAVAGKSQNTPTAFDPENTFVVLVGVLEWKDQKSLHAFSNKNRKDSELYNALKNAGVPAQHIVHLIDKDATLPRIQKELMSMAGKTTNNSTFIFYYAGHGIKKEKDTYFANYEIDVAHCKKTGFGISYLSSTLVPKAKSSTFIFMADCCYSGSLLEEGAKVSAAGKNTVVMTSATASNISTGNWTFTQTLLDGLKGEQLMDRDSDGKITLTDYKTEFADAMKYREHQMGGFYFKGVNENYAWAQVTTTASKEKSATGNFANGKYAFGLIDGNWHPVRILKQVNTNNYHCRFYFYSDYKDKELTAEEVKSFYFPAYKAGDKVKVIWEGKRYDAEIKKAENDFYYIHYTDYDDSYDEWVMYDRIRTGKEKQVQIEYQNSWYDGEVISEVSGKYFVRYSGYDFSWDELVSKERIKFKN